MAPTGDRKKFWQEEQAEPGLGGRTSDASPAAFLGTCPPESIPFRQKCHPACIACRETAQGGLGLAFRPEEVEGVSGVYGVLRCEPKYQGYPDRLHGGIIALAIDAAMTHCLFFQQVQAVTARLELRYRQPVRLGIDVALRAHVVSQRGTVYKLAAEARQGLSVCAEANATFMDLGATRGP